MQTTAETPTPLQSRIPAGDAPAPSRVVYTAAEIRARVGELGRAITCFYREDVERSGALVVLGVLKGSFVFLSDLVRVLEIPVHVDFLTASSYGSSTTTSGTVRILNEPDLVLEDRPVLLVEDVVDSGTTLDRILPLLEERSPTSVELCTLLHKEREEARRKQDAAGLAPRWVGFSAPDEFLVGYGLDYSENYRHLPYIATFEEMPVPRADD